MTETTPAATPATTKPELVVALVSAIGTRIEGIETALAYECSAIGYTTETVRISHLLETECREAGGPERPATSSRSRWLMDLGDHLRSETGYGAAAVALAVTDIQLRRAEAAANERDELDGRVWVIRSVKRDDEVEALREAYGSRLLVLGVADRDELRFQSLCDTLIRDNPVSNLDWCESEARALMKRDQADQRRRKWGQRVRAAFSLCDAYIRLDDDCDLRAEIKRLVATWFSDPFASPTAEEQGMFYAASARLRSAAAGRQVGVAVVDADGEVLVTGANDVPKPGGGQFWTGDDPDHRDFHLEVETNDLLKNEVAQDALERLSEAGWLALALTNDPKPLTLAAVDDGGPLAQSQLVDLTEFGRILHAEMAAICTAARRGTAIRNTTMFTTTFPCHSCARLIIGAGITTVVYVDPYPKSRALRMYGEMISDGPATAGKVRFVPFHGVAPRWFTTAFAMNKGDRERSVDGRFDRWVPVPLGVKGPNGLPLLALEDGVLETFRPRYARAAWADFQPNETVTD